MKLRPTIHEVIKDRQIVLPWITLVVLSFILIVVELFRIRPSELNIPTRYSTFGQTFIYNDAWYYLLSFVVFVLVVVAIHTLITVKLYSLKGPLIARFFLGLSILLIVIAFFWLNSILGVASLLQ